MRYLFSLWMIVLLSSSLSAQSNRFRSGEILLKNGIEKTGFVFGQFNLGAPKGVYFKTSETEKTEYIEFKDIQEVQFGSTERYLTYCTQNTAQQTCHWLKTLLQGKISLHQSVADRGLYFMEDAGTFNAIRQPSFAGTLTLLKRKCPDFVPPADTKFETQNLIQTVVNYNACKNPGDQLKSHYVSTVSKGSWYLGPKAGINLSSASIFKNHYYGLGEYSVAPAFTSGAVIRYQISPNWAVASEVAYFQSSPQSDSVNVWPVVSRNYSKVEMEFAFLEIPVLGQYYFSKGKISPFFQAGIHLGLPIKRTLSEEMFAAEPDELADQPKNSFIGPAVGYGGGLGLNVKLSEKTQVQLLGQYTQWSTTLNSSSRLFESSGFEDKTPINLSRLQIGVQVMLKL